MRRIDDIIDYIANHEHLSSVDKIILISRVDRKPTQEEIDAARIKLQGEEDVRIH